MVEKRPNSAAALDIASQPHPDTNARKHDTEGPLVLAEGKGHLRLHGAIIAPSERGVMRHSLRAVVLVLSAGVLAACSTTMLEVPPGSDAYRAGYRDGCDSGYSVAGNAFYGPDEDVQRAPTDALYRQGWAVGFAQCERNFQRIQRSIFVLLTP